MAIIETPNQFKYTGKGPVDYKALVKTYADLLDPATWTTKQGSLVAYNGMIVSVWLNKADTTKNGVYYLFDPQCTTPLAKPDVANEANWKRLDGAAELADYIALIQDIESRVEQLESEEKIHTYGYRASFPTEGTEGHMYVAVDEKKSYVWFNNDYISVGGGDYEEPDIIYGGSAD